MYVLASELKNFVVILCIFGYKQRLYVVLHDYQFNLLFISIILGYTIFSYPSYIPVKLCWHIGLTPMYSYVTYKCCRIYILYTYMYIITHVYIYIYIYMLVIYIMIIHNCNWSNNYTHYKANTTIVAVMSYAGVIQY